MTVNVPATNGSTETCLPLKGVRLLIIDDAPDLCRLYRTVLEMGGATVSTSLRATDGIEMALRSDFDLVLMDLEMPELSGIEAATMLRGRGYSGTLVALSGYSDGHHTRAALTAGYSGYLCKSLSIAELVTQVSSWVGVGPQTS